MTFNYDPKKGLTTYETGIIQAKAYRALRITMTTALKKYNLSMSEWSLLGTIYEKRNVKYSELADLLEVKAPLITKIMESLLDKGLVESEQDKDDKRSKFLVPTKKAYDLVPVIEKDVKIKVNSLIPSISHDELLVYMKMLHAIADSLKTIK